MTPIHRDLSAPELWERSLARSRLRRALAPRVRREHKRRKGLSAAAAAATMAGPGTPMAMAQMAGGGDVQGQVAAETSSVRAIEIRDGGLPLRYGSEGELVAHVQKALQIPADGVFGAQTDTAVRQYQMRAGLEVDGIVGPDTWGSLFASSSAVGGSNVAPEVKQRIEQRLESAGRRIDAQLAATQGAGSSGDTAGGSTDVRTSAPVGGDGPVGDAPAGGGDADEAPAGGQSDTPSAGGGLEGTTPVSGTCGSTLSSPVKGTVTSEYGPRWGRNHDGVDIAAPTGTAVRAAACGSVTVAGAQSGYGNMVCITHTSQFSTCYAHLSRFATSQGAQVRQGQVIGYVGCTGSCTGPHLHFETRVNGQAQNPRGYMNGMSVPGSARTATGATAVGGPGTKVSRKTSTQPAATATMSSSGGAATRESLEAREAAAMAAVGPTSPTAPPGTPEAMTQAAPAEPTFVPSEPTPAQTAPAEAAPVPVEGAPVPAEAAPAETTVPAETVPVDGTVPTETAVPVETTVPAETAVPVETTVPAETAPVETAVPVEAAPVPTEAAPVPVEAAPVPTEAAPVPVEAAPVPVEPAPAPMPAPVEPAPAPAPAPVPAPVEPAPVPAPAPVEAAPVPAPAEPAPAPVEAAPAAPAPVESAPAEAVDATATATTDTGGVAAPVE